jgi:hypothetical protein
MIDPPKRTGYRLTYDAQMYYDDWKEYGGCRCFQGNAPCGACTHEGHPISLEDNDEAWELDEGWSRKNLTWQMIADDTSPYGRNRRYKDMARDNITDKSSPPKSEWFGYKYRVTPESSRLLQGAVFKDGGRWVGAAHTTISYLGDIYLEVKEDGNIWRPVTDKGFSDSDLPEKQPPQAKKEDELKEFKVGKWYKNLNGSFVKAGTYYQLKEIQGVLLVFKGVDSQYHPTRFDINSESDYDPNAMRFVPEIEKKVVAKDIEGGKLATNQSGNNATTNVGDVNMSNSNGNLNRVVSVKFFDDDAGLKAENSLVASYEITTRANDAMTVNKLLMREDIAGDIDLHNAVRASTVDATILKNTGNKVFLQPIDFEDLRVVVSNV